jgi:hypothetical protein
VSIRPVLSLAPVLPKMNRPKTAEKAGSDNPGLCARKCARNSEKVVQNGQTEQTGQRRNILK